MMRPLLAATLLTLGLVFGGSVHAQAYPSRPVTLIVPFPPGGPADIIARLLQPHLAATLGQPLLIDNRAGGNSNIGHSAVARAAPDGYTILYVVPSIVTNPALFLAPMVNPMKELAPVAQMTTQSYVLMAHPSFKPRTMAEIIDAARQGGVTCASGGGLPGFGCDWLRAMTKVDIVHVRYKGTQALADLIGGRVNIMLDLFNTALPQIKAGKVHAIALTRAERGQPLPDIPVVNETLPGFVLVGWHGIMAPAGTPAPVIETLNAAFVQALAVPAVRGRIGETHIEVTPSSAAEFGKVLERDTEKFARIVRDAGIKPE